MPRSRPGLPLRDMSAQQRRLVWALVDAVLSAEGAAKVRGVLALEAMLQERTANKAFRDPLNYALALFGAPGPAPWAWRFEGHHVSLTLTIVAGIGIAVTPHFLRRQPVLGPGGRRTVMAASPGCWSASRRWPSSSSTDWARRHCGRR